ncbi:acyltransferase [Colwellia sp. Bg11-12]|jgi:acetyltransferase-like isoleucine patch superfamily enzyme|uniref:acyltransferase n=1 Tax=Colwellia sp. Bg11-12 TaxID=2759817 RepID=UPI0015F4472E|nr:acyltransferase [Colwellia sp. Bg11-12]MBA6264793.1 acyltransferase [Colwellia sp. Bg11-12]
MAYLTRAKLIKMGFKYLGDNVKISDKASIYDADKISIDSFSRIDDFCVISGSIDIGKYVHITPMCLIAGGQSGVFIADFCTLAYGVKVFAQSDDYSGETMTNSLIPQKYKNEYIAKVTLQKHVILGANSVVLPGVNLAEGSSGGAMTLFDKNTSSWGIYVGTPAKRIKERKKNLLDLEKKFQKEILSD